MKTLFCGLALLAGALMARTLLDQYGETASRIIDAAMADNGGYEKLEYLCDRLGPRLAGSTNMALSVAWAAEQMRHDGLVNVSTPAVRVPHWTRGSETASLLEPVNRTLTILGLGG